MPKLFIQLIENKVLLIAIVAWLLAQTIKVLVVLQNEHRFTLMPFLSSGGMPSAHSAMVTSVATAIGRYDGWSSPTFGLAVVFALVVMYDAAGVRRAAGKQAELLNRIVEDISLISHERTQERLKELIGHTPVQVVAGLILGIIVAYLI